MQSSKARTAAIAARRGPRWVASAQGQQRKCGRGGERHRRDDPAPAERIIGGGEDNFRQPFVRHPALTVGRERQCIPERDRAMFQNPAPDHNVGQRVSVTESGLGGNAD